MLCLISEYVLFLFFFKQKTAYEMRISDWSSDVCSSDLLIQMHGGHGYLIHQFLSPLSNQRTDEYGGSLENRMRFPLETFQAMRAAWPAHKPMGIRVSATDWVEGGFTPDEAVVFAKALEIGRAHV